MPHKLTNDRALRILAAAREEFARWGLDGARVARIARRAAVNKQLLFYYYHSKRGLFQAVLSRGARELEQAMARVAVPAGSTSPLLGRLRAPLEAQVYFLARDSRLVTLLTPTRPSGGPPVAPALSPLRGA